MKEKHKKVERRNNTEHIEKKDNLSHAQKCRALTIYILI